MISQEEWVPVLKSNDIAAGDLVPVEVDGLAILVAADLDGKIFAIANSCPHLGTPLENGRYFPYSTYLEYFPFYLSHSFCIDFIFFVLPINAFIITF